MQFSIYLPTESVPPDLTVWRPYWKTGVSKTIRHPVPGKSYPIGEEFYFPVLDRPQPISEVFLFRDLPEGKGKIVVEIARAVGSKFDNVKTYTSGWVMPDWNSTWEFNVSTRRFRQVLPQRETSKVPLIVALGLGTGLALIAVTKARGR